MSSRHVRKAKSAISSYNEKRHQQTTPRSKKPTQSTSVINVTDASTPEEILHSSWKFLYIYQFLTQFQHQLGLPSISIDHMESLLLFRPDPSTDDMAEQNLSVDDNQNSFNDSNEVLSRESSVLGSSSVISDQFNNSTKLQHTLAKLLVLILASLSDDKKNKITENNYPQYIYKYLYHHSLDERVQDILGRYTDSIDFVRLSIVDKIYVLKDLVDSIFETGTALIWKNELASEDMRAFPMGKDSDGWSYWIFGGSRLYREIQLSPRKKETDYTFQLIAKTEEEWRTWMNKFSLDSPKALERHLAENLQEHGSVIIQKIESRRAAKLREEAKLEKARKLDLLPRKRSRRIEVKSEEDDRRRQLEEMERAQLEFEEAEREREQRELEEQLEKEKQEMQIEEARLKEEVYQLLDAMVTQEYHKKQLVSQTDTTNKNGVEDDDKITKLKQLRTKLKKSATLEETVEKLKGWNSLLEEGYKIAIHPLTSAPNSTKVDIQHESTNAVSPDLSIPVVTQPENQLTEGTGSQAIPLSDTINALESSSIMMPDTQTQTLATTNTNDDLSTQSVQQPVINRISNSVETMDSSVISATSSQAQSSGNEDLTIQSIPQTIFDVPSTSSAPETLESTPMTSTTTTTTTTVPSSSQLVTTTSMATPTLPRDDFKTIPSDISPITQQQAPEQATILTTTPVISTAPTKTAPVVKRGRPRKVKKPTVDKSALSLTFSDVLRFTGNGSKSDLKDPLLKLILTTMISQIRQYAANSELERRKEKKSGNKRKKSVIPVMDMYTVHKKLLLGKYVPESIDDTEESHNVKSAFESWLSDMDLVLARNDPITLDLKKFSYDLFISVLM
ncbi:uncharacterized protein BX664DRAFT_336165 [Halteromyces radiatus]|uniref:uncharacterized protein n=1 Tax=Halteromyces radiatus TaxID=101107 RepID=UPI00221F2335|nr:uncharacterized protein BX664DRAFT_336165 [Halteromyces radiatus]KAI8086568.1 hypothetical protein BX664DRAFT_336165 [Halteromyces radiatus]